jgi:hypothetical protein
MSIDIEIETAIRRMSWATAQVGQKSLQKITVDFATHTVSSTYITGTTHVFGVDLSSVRNSFLILRPRFSGTSAFFSVSGETASGVRVMPNINYSFDFEVSPTEVKFSGSHDGYPSYHIAINSRSAYDYIQGHLGQLFGTSDVTVPLSTFVI